MINAEFWTYGTLYERKGQQVFKINERKEFLGIHNAAQILMDERNLTMVQAYEYLNGLKPV